jgi:tetratricopeptide (TPR) repeat protein
MTPGQASRSPALTYVEARAAGIDGNSARSAALFAELARQSKDPVLRRTAISSAIDAGRNDLALQLMAGLPTTDLSIDARLLRVADSLRRGRIRDAIMVVETPDPKVSIAFLGPLLRAWERAGHRDVSAALAALDAAPDNGVLAPFRDQERALILLKLGHPDAAAEIAKRVGGGVRDRRLRFVLADGLWRLGKREQALAIIDAMGLEGAAAKARLQAGKGLDQSIGNEAEAFSDLLTALATGFGRSEQREIPINLLRAAQAADPRNASAAILVGYVLADLRRYDDALAAYRTVQAADVLASDARSTEVAVLEEAGRRSEAVALARSQAARPDAGANDYRSLAQILAASEQHAEAAEMFARAIALAGPQTAAGDLWPLYLGRASALLDAGRWPESRAVLGAALTIAPAEPLLLNFLGYSKLERGEDLDGAEAMIRKASALAPDNGSIIDSLGWALFKRGKTEEAIDLLRKAALSAPAESEIHEHLGDALYSAGRRYEARFAWSAALITAEAERRARLKAKLDGGLSAATAAP